MMKINSESIKLNVRRRLRDYRLLLAIGLPLAGASVGDIATGLVDTALIGRYSVDALAAVGIGVTVFVAFLVLAVVLAIGQQIITAQSFGAKNYSRIGRVLLHGLVVFLPISVLMALGASLGSSWIVGIIAPNASEATASAAADYILIRCAVIPMIVVLAMMHGILAGDKQTKWIFFGLILLNAVNIGLSYPLIYGFWFIPELGCSGECLGQRDSRICRDVVYRGCVHIQALPTTDKAGQLQDIFDRNQDLDQIVGANDNFGVFVA